MSTNARKAPKRADPAEAPLAQADQDPDEQEQAPEAAQEPQAEACRVVFEKDPATGRVYMTTRGCTEEQVEQVSRQVLAGDFWTYAGDDPDQTTLVLGTGDEVEQEPDEDDQDDEPDEVDDDEVDPEDEAEDE